MKTTEILLPKGKLIVTPINDSCVRLTAYGLNSVMHVIPEANNAIQIKLERFSER